MKTKRKSRVLSEKEVDKIVIAQADDDSAWEKPIRVRRPRPASVPLPAELATRAAFFARLHRQSNVEDWLQQIIQERLDLEEAAFAGVKRDFVKSGA
jgi:hypothetical protein